MLSASASAEITHQSEGGFATSASRNVAVPPAEAWEALVHPEKWWNGAHSWSGDAVNFSLDPTAGGCFCEAMPAEEKFVVGGVEHMRVVSVMPGRQLRLAGALGPLQSEGLAATLTVELKPSGGGTEILWSYVVGGYARFPFAQVAPAVDGVMTEQLGRLSRFIETGSPEPR